MRGRASAVTGGAVLVAGTLLGGHLTASPASAVTPMVGKHQPGKPDQPGKPGKPDQPGKPGKPDQPETPDATVGRKHHRSPDRPKHEPDHSAPPRRRPPAPPPDQTPPATPALSAAGVGAGGSVWLPVRAEYGARLVVAEVGGPLEATGIGTGGYTTLRWATTGGTHTYVVTATDASGNRSRSARVTVFVDTTPPVLSSLGVTAGTPSDTRTRLTFRTDRFSAYRVLLDGRQVLAGSAPAGPVSRLLDLPNGGHRMEVQVSDAIGNTRSRVRSVTVRIGTLAVATRLTTDATTRTQVVRVRATPTATRGVLRIAGQEPTRFIMARGAGTVKVRLQDGAYAKATVLVRDGQGRTGRSRVALAVDTTPPTLEVVPDETGAAEGTLRAAVTTEDGSKVRWRLLDTSGSVATSGKLAVQDGRGTITADVGAGRYRLVVAATDAYHRATTVRALMRIAETPALERASRAAAVVGSLAGMAALALVGGFLLRRYGPSLLTLLAWLGKVRSARDAAAERRIGARQRYTEDAASPDRIAVRVPRQRVPDRGSTPDPSGVLPPGVQVLHRTPVRFYEAAGEGNDGLILASRTGELVIAREAIAFVDDATHQGWSRRVAELEHVFDDSTMVLPEGEQDWVGLEYGDGDATRRALDLVAAGHAPTSGAQAQPAGQL